MIALSSHSRCLYKLEARDRKVCKQRRGVKGRTIKTWIILGENNGTEVREERGR